MKKKILKNVIIVLCILFLLFVIDFTRKYIILRDIMNKGIENASATNYHQTHYQFDGDNYSKTDGYYKDGKMIIKHNFISSDGYLRQMINVYKDDKMDTYIMVEDSKIAVLGGDNPHNPSDFSTGMEEFTIKQWIYTILSARISTDYVNGKECYKWSVTAPSIGSLVPLDYKYDYFEFMKNKNDFYYEKETGLRLRMVYTSRMTGTNDEGYFERVNEVVIDDIYEFGTVTDADLVEPDISEFTIQERN